VARVLGDSIQTVMKSYAHWMPNPARDTAAKLDAIYGKHALYENSQGGGKGAVSVAS